jgi:hypothetical protein
MLAEGNPTMALLGLEALIWRGHGFDFYSDYAHSQFPRPPFLLPS